jgi:hypothetical protein
MMTWYRERESVGPESGLACLAFVVRRMHDSHRLKSVAKQMRIQHADTTHEQSAELAGKSREAVPRSAVPSEAGLFFSQGHGLSRFCLPYGPSVAAQSAVRRVECCRKLSSMVQW